MILTGKARKDCLKHHNVGLKIFLGWRKHLQQALIIDWLDTVGIYVEVGVYPEENGDINFSYTLFGNSSSENFEYFKTRQEATIAAIKLANDLYNGNK